MRWERTVTLWHAHAEGEVGRVIVGGVLDVPGATMFEKKLWLEREGDELRRLCLLEPRGSAAMSANLVLPPTRPEAQAGFVVMESTDYPAMSGSNAMCVVTVLLETGAIAMREPTTTLVLDTPAGLVTATAVCRDGKCERVTLECPPAFVDRLDAPLEVEGLGTIACDVAYGGAFFAQVDAAALGFALEAHEARELVEIGERIAAAAAAQLDPRHPENPEIRGVGFTHFGGPPRAPDGARRSAVAIRPGRLDRSPCGTGTLAKLASLHARGAIGIGETLIHESPIGSRFLARAVAETRVGGRPALRAQLTGRAWIAGLMQLGRDPSDPFADGFMLADTWGPGAARDP